MKCDLINVFQDKNAEKVNIFKAKTTVKQSIIFVLHVALIDLNTVNLEHLSILTKILLRKITW